MAVGGRSRSEIGVDLCDDSYATCHGHCESPQVVLMVNRLPTDKPPTTCAFCGKPLKAHNAWRSTSGNLYCSEFCADDEEQDACRDRRRA